MKKYLKVAIKIALTGLALFIVSKKIDVEETKILLLNVNVLWLLLALLLFNTSKITSAFRLNLFFQSIGLFISNQLNLVLYYIGMFYNLFLPGGIGGDGYKVYILNKNYQAPVKSLVTAALFDRLSGLAALAFLAIGLGIFSNVYEQVGIMLGSVKYLLWIALLLVHPVFYLVSKFLFKESVKFIHQTNALSVGVQVFQLVCAFFILQALGVESNHLDYLALFLISSVVAVLPFTIGGVGARELVFLLGYEYLPINQNSAIAFTLLFFLITALSSLTGSVLSMPEKAMATD